MHRRFFSLLVLAVVLCGLSTFAAAAATNVFLKLEPAGQAAAEAIPALGFRMPGSLSPRDSSTGMPTGKRQHQPLVIVKRVDAASPVIRAQQPKGPIKTVEILFVSEASEGAKQESHTIRLTDASIVTVRPGQEPATEEIVLDYATIWVDGKDATGENVLTRAFVVPHILERTGSVTK